MEFSEAQTSWQSIPAWASCMIEFGYEWMRQSRHCRMIAVISMPSDSAAAGLVALGAMRRCLELNDASDISVHYKKLLDLAKTQPDEVKFRKANVRGVFAFDGIDRDGYLWVKKLNSRSKDRLIIVPSSAKNWSVNGEAPVILVNDLEVPNKQLYYNLVNNGGDIKQSNLTESYSQVCLAGRGAGEAPTKASMTDIRFREDGVEANLTQMLTVQSWMPGTISRMLFYNPRKEQFDRQTGNPKVVIADGDISFLKAVDGADFQDSDIIGVVHRTMERERLKDIGTKMQELRNWYDYTQIDWLPKMPRGIGIIVFNRRQRCL